MILFGACRFTHVINPDNNLSFIFATIFNLLMLLIPTVCGTLMWCNTPKFNDSFDLVREHQILGRLLCVIVIMYITVYIIGFAGASEVCIIFFFSLSLFWS